MIQKNQNRLEDAVKRVLQQDTTAEHAPDEQALVVIHNGQAIPIAYQTNELVNGRTVSTVNVQASSGGTTFTGVEDFLIAECGCQLNARLDKIYRCSFCQKIYCPEHTRIWHKKGIAYCCKFGCSLTGRLHQLGYYFSELVVFSFSQVFGFEKKPDTKVISMPMSGSEQTTTPTPTPSSRIPEFDSVNNIVKVRSSASENNR